MGQVEWNEIFKILGLVVASRSQLLACGATPRMLTSAVRFRHLERLRRDHYVLPGHSSLLRTAVRCGGVVTCTSALALRGAFAFDDKTTHIAVLDGSSRIRGLRHGKPLSPAERGTIVRHWWPCDAQPDSATASLTDALAHLVRCQPRPLALASLESALHRGLVRASELPRIFERVPERLRHLMAEADGRAESGQETVLRLLVQDAGMRVEPQVTFPRIGRVDLLVEGRVVLEADSRAHHAGWEHHVHDRGRDLALAARGYPSLRPAFNHTMYNPSEVVEAVRGLVRRADSVDSRAR